MHHGDRATHLRDHPSHSQGTYNPAICWLRPNSTNIFTLQPIPSDSNLPSSLRPSLHRLQHPGGKSSSTKIITAFSPCFPRRLRARRHSHPTHPPISITSAQPSFTPNVQIKQQQQPRRQAKGQQPIYRSSHPNARPTRRARPPTKKSNDNRCSRRCFSRSTQRISSSYRRTQYPAQVAPQSRSTTIIR